MPEIAPSVEAATRRSRVHRRRHYAPRIHRAVLCRAGRARIPMLSAGAMQLHGTQLGGAGDRNPWLCASMRDEAERAARSRRGRCDARRARGCAGGVSHSPGSASRATRHWWRERKRRARAARDDPAWLVTSSSSFCSSFARNDLKSAARSRVAVVEREIAVRLRARRRSRGRIGQLIVESVVLWISRWARGTAPVATWSVRSCAPRSFWRHCASG